MSRRIGILGAGVTPFKGTWREKTYYELAQMAVREAVKDAQIDIHDVDAAFYGIYNDIFERAAIPEHAIHGLVGMQDKFGIRIPNDAMYTFYQRTKGEFSAFFLGLRDEKKLFG
jgi:acetyl-CoA acetyltransferase